VIIKLSILDLVKWGVFVATMGMSFGVAKKNGMDFMQTLNTVEEQNKTILAAQIVILAEQDKARRDRKSTLEYFTKITKSETK